MVAGFTEQLQKTSYQKIKSSYGDYQTLEFYSKTVLQHNNLEVYRFKAQFNRNDAIEIRTVLNSDGKLAGFFIIPWKNHF